MRNSCLAILAITSLLLFPAGRNPQAAEPTGISNGNGVRIRTKPDRSAGVLGALSKGQKVVLIDRTNHTELIDGKKASWVRVSSTSGVHGWVFGAYIKPTDDRGDNISASKEGMGQGIDFLTFPEGTDGYQFLKVYPASAPFHFVSKSGKLCQGVVGSPLPEGQGSSVLFPADCSEPNTGYPAVFDRPALEFAVLPFTEIDDPEKSALADHFRRKGHLMPELAHGTLELNITTEVTHFSFSADGREVGLMHCKIYGHYGDGSSGVTDLEVVIAIINGKPYKLPIFNRQTNRAALSAYKLGHRTYLQADTGGDSCAGVRTVFRVDPTGLICVYRSGN